MDAMGGGGGGGGGGGAIVLPRRNKYDLNPLTPGRFETWEK